MKYLTLIRHAKSSWESMSSSDHERPLNQRGLRDAPEAGKYLQKQSFPIEKIFSSDAERAQTTASLINQALKLPLEKESALYTFNASDLSQFILAVEDGFTSIAIVGHNPALTEFLNALLGEEATANLPTCSIAHMQLDVMNWEQVDDGCATLQALYTPKKILL